MTDDNQAGSEKCFFVLSHCRTHNRDASKCHCELNCQSHTETKRELEQERARAEELERKLDNNKLLLDTKTSENEELTRKLAEAEAREKQKDSLKRSIMSWFYRYVESPDFTEGKSEVGERIEQLSCDYDTIQSDSTPLDALIAEKEAKARAEAYEKAERLAQTWAMNATLSEMFAKLKEAARLTAKPRPG